MKITVCKNDKQIHALADCAKVIWNEYFINIISQAQIDYMVDKFQSYPALKKAIQEDGYTYFLAYENEALMGFCGVQVQEDRLFLSKLYIKAESRGKGISSTLLQEAINFAKEHACHAIYLTCNKYNQHSLDVYAHKGFVITDAVETDIGHG